MKVAFRQLGRHLEHNLAKVYLVAGDEPLLTNEALDDIRGAARSRGFESRELHVVDRSFRWSELEGSVDNLSLFAARKIVELRLPSPRPGDAGARSLRSLVERPDPDCLLLVAIAGRLDASAAKTVWVKSIEQNGVLVEIWPIDRKELPRWIRERASRLGVELSTDAARVLAERVEGNLLAADQELRKLALANPGARIDEANVLDAVADSARFDVFRLVDAVLAGESRRAIRVLRGLRAEGVEPVLVSWALSRELGLLARLKYAVEHGTRLDDALARHGVWRRRQAVVKQALGRLHWSDLTALLAQAVEVDGIIKGVASAQSWDALTALVMSGLGIGRMPPPNAV